MKVQGLRGDMSGGRGVCSLVATPCHWPYPLSAFNTSPEPREIRANALERWGWGRGRVAAAAWQAPGPQHVWGEMGGSLRDVIQVLSLGGKKPKKNMYL